MWWIPGILVSTTCFSECFNRVCYAEKTTYLHFFRQLYRRQIIRRKMDNKTCFLCTASGHYLTLFRQLYRRQIIRRKMDNKTCSLCTASGYYLTLFRQLYRRQIIRRKTK